MIRIINHKIDCFIRFLNGYLEVSKEIPDVNIHLLEESDTIEAPSGESSFGLFNTETNDIYIACGSEVMDNEQIIKTIAHEYMHVIQKYTEIKSSVSTIITNSIYDEDKADKFAEDVYRKFIKQYAEDKDFLKYILS